MSYYFHLIPFDQRTGPSPHPTRARSKSTVTPNGVHGAAHQLMMLNPPAPSLSRSAIYKIGGAGGRRWSHVAGVGVGGVVSGPVSGSGSGSGSGGGGGERGGEVGVDSPSSASSASSSPSPLPPEPKNRRRQSQPPPLPLLLPLPSPLDSARFQLNTITQHPSRSGSTNTMITTSSTSATNHKLSNSQDIPAPLSSLNHHPHPIPLPLPQSNPDDAAEREVIEDSETWDDLSEDGTFNLANQSQLDRFNHSAPHLSPIKARKSQPHFHSNHHLALHPPSSKSTPSSPAPSLQSAPRHRNSQRDTLSPADLPNSPCSPSDRPYPYSPCPIPAALESPAEPLVRADVDSLIQDPANALSQLTLDDDGEPSPGGPPSAAGPGALPWNAVLPASLIQGRPDPPPRATTLPGGSEPATAATPASGSASGSSQEIRKQRKFVCCLGAPTVDVAALRQLAWSGVPDRLRALVWQILLGYLPAPASRRVAVLARKRQEYADAVRLAFGKGTGALDQTIWHQIQIDVARTNPGVPLWQFPATQRSLERILYVWAIRHPASGYVQGINDLVTPFFQVFLAAYVSGDPERFDVGQLPPEALAAVEADAFWSLSKLLEGIQDNYIFAQPGIQRQVARMKELCERVDSRLHKHLESEKVEFIQFAFRWINCLLMRELSTKKIIRMWDTYLAEGTAAFSEFHLYVCLAFLVRYSDQLRTMDFQAIIMFLQSLPTQDWTSNDIEMILSQAFMWYSLFQGAVGHFVRK